MASYAIRPTVRSETKVWKTQQRNVDVIYRLKAKARDTVR